RGLSEFFIRPFSWCRKPSEREAYSRRVAAWCNKMRSAKRGEKVIQRFLVCKIDHCKLHRHFVPVGVHDIIETKAHIEEMTRRDSWWILIVILSAVGRNLHPQCAPVWV